MSAYFSLKNNLKYLFIRYDYIWQIDIPNATNWLKLIFGHIKAKVSLHRLLKKERKIKLILSLLSGKFQFISATHFLVFSQIIC